MGAWAGRAGLESPPALGTGGYGPAPTGAGSDRGRFRQGPVPIGGQCADTGHHRTVAWRNG